MADEQSSQATRRVRHRDTRDNNFEVQKEGRPNQREKQARKEVIGDSYPKNLWVS